MAAVAALLRQTARSQMAVRGGRAPRIPDTGAFSRCARCHTEHDRERGEGGRERERERRAGAAKRKEDNGCFGRRFQAGSPLGMARMEREREGERKEKKVCVSLRMSVCVCVCVCVAQRMREKSW